MINHLQLINNLLIKKFKCKDLQAVMDFNNYHSSEDSETDLENKKNNIVIKDLR